VVVEGPFVVVVVVGSGGVPLIFWGLYDYSIFFLIFWLLLLWRQGGQDFVDEPVSSLTLSFGMRFWGFATELMFDWDFIYFVCLLFASNFFVYGLNDL
jgi:hypothetical protein